ncbi:MAG: Flp pilus assembly complex ATPase component TadA [Actinobacteria bacterium]|nr:Flp pilus assembly complex ATPase component TadA [Actinomycetota bacterium]
MAGAGNGLSDALEIVLEHDELADLDEAARRLAMRALLIDNGSSPRVVERVAAFVDGYGALDPLIRDERVTDILVNGYDDVWVERDGVLARSPIVFSSEEEFRATIERLISRGGGRVDTARPIADVALPNGSRMHVVLPPLAPDGPKVSIRRFPESPLRLEDLQDRGMFDDALGRLLVDAVRGRKTIAISGGTGSGKTTLLNALLAEVPDTERIVTIEETPELQPQCGHCVSLVARPPNVEGYGEVTLSDLFRATLRMRPDRIVVGEVRGAEALVALDAFSTGHPGSLVTVHARSAADVVDRFVSLAAAGSRLSESTLRTRFTHAFDLVVHLARVNGRRFVHEVETT